jgi:pyridoxal phosphate enzyme (YggS family)
VLDPAAVRARLAAVRARIARAAERAHRDPSDIRLVAVSKTFSTDYIRAAADAGQLEFGENKVQEAVTKMIATPDLPIRWHLVGHLQSNKARKAAEHFSTIHSVDSVALFEKLDAAASAAGRRLDLLVQVDLASEPTKHGLPPDQVGALFEAAAGGTHGVIRGLMAIPPAVDHPEQARPHFAALRRLRDQLLDQGIPPAALAHLSMGMSHDFEVAIEEGATMVRVGSAIFGDRPRG